MMQPKKVPVDVWAKEYERARPIGDATITDVTTGERWTTGEDGYAHLIVEPGRKLTLAFNKAGYPPVQTATVTVPPEGLATQDTEITLQVVNKVLEKALLHAFGGPLPGLHYLAVTVSAKGRNLHNDKGEPGVTVTLRSKDGKIVRNDGIYLHTFMHKTDWVRPILAENFRRFNKWRSKSTSTDGGVIFKDVPPGDYIIEASKLNYDGKPVVFKSTEVTITKSSPRGINISPPQGPRVL